MEVIYFYNYTLKIFIISKKKDIDLSMNCVLVDKSTAIVWLT